MKDYCQNELCAEYVYGVTKFCLNHLSNEEILKIEKRNKEFIDFKISYKIQNKQIFLQAQIKWAIEKIASNIKDLNILHDQLRIKCNSQIQKKYNQLKHYCNYDISTVLHLLSHLHKNDLDEIERLLLENSVF
jgi:DNA gyrase/topoisomerase IV subunit B